MNNLDYMKRRFLAAFIDSVFVGAVCILLHIPWKILPLPGIVFQALSIMTFLCGGLIILLKDGPYTLGILDGQSPGKQQMRLRVTKLDGKTPADWKDSVARNLPLALPYFWSSGLVILQMLPIPGFINWFIMLIAGLGGMIAVTAVVAYESWMIYKDPENRRWGDHKAVTRVVEE
ncbi:MAG: RDD family protein [Candidatus Riflebacteria bacterium]|nr:RDD family protein [Candidatus Riflebacteria bacterium]